MSAFDSIQGVLDKHIAPVATKLSSSNIIKALSGGMMATMPVSLGVAIIAIVINLPIPGFSEFLATSGLSAVANQVLAVTMNLMALYIVWTISYRFGESQGIPGMTSAVVTAGVFLVLMPLVVEQQEYSASYFINTVYLGSNGIFVGILLGIIVPAVLARLLKHVALPLPDSVPPMVSESLTPVFAAIILFTGCFFIKWGLTFTPWGNLFDLINTIVAMPIMRVGSSPLALIAVYTFSSFLWFFGVHPSAVVNVYAPVMSTCMMANVEALVSGQPLPYLSWAVVYLVMSIGGTGEGIGAALSSLTAKSARYKAISKLGVIPAIFNISEPLMFGMPIVLNPMFLIPMVLATPVCGFIAWGASLTGLFAAFNPAVQAPWIMPWPVTGLLQGGIAGCAVVLICVAVATLIFYPFFRMADKQALAEEHAAESVQEA